ncbi:hypothetical protein AB0F43_37265 [Kribbella sp. NPDC023972]|uniref:hypothetical protein n=1 Tax=Kribbella sp. NPDC023972 TaxID=3154795 RepID=UPI00340999F8
MGKLTDEELEQLLRETFADKEKLADSLPEATTRQWSVAPVLLAAATVLAVLAGILYGVNRGRDADPAPPVATSGVAGASADATQNADIWAAAITAMARRFAPPEGWSALEVLDRPSGVGIQARQESRAAQFSPAVKQRISQLAGTVAPVRWPTQAVFTQSCTTARIAGIAVGEIVTQGDHKEVRVSISYNCDYGYAQTYRVEKVRDAWTATGTVGVGEGTVPAGGCPLSRTTPASPRVGC